MRAFITIVLFMCLSESIAQQITISDARDASYVNGTSLKNGSTLMPGKNVKVKGHLEMKYGHWTLYLQQGIYNMDSVILNLKQKREYVIDDSVYSILKTKNLYNCRDNSIQCGNPYKYLNPSNKNDRVTKASSDSVVLTWQSESRAQPELYYVVLSNMWEEYIGIHATDKKELILNLRPYKKEKNIFYRIISADCFQSETKQIQIE